MSAQFQNALQLITSELRATETASDGAVAHSAYLLATLAVSRESAGTGFGEAQCVFNAAVRAVSLANDARREIARVHERALKIGQRQAVAHGDVFECPPDGPKNEEPQKLRVVANVG